MCNVRVVCKCDGCSAVPGDGSGLWEFICSSGLHLVCTGPVDLSHSTDTTVKWMSSKCLGTVFIFF